VGFDFLYNVRLKRIQRDVQSSCEVPLFARFESEEFCLHILEKYETDFKKIRSVGAEMFHADGETEGQTDMTKIIVFYKTLRNLLRSAHTAVFMFFVWISEQTAIIFLYNIN
jgi:hypothetical protein